MTDKELLAKAAKAAGAEWSDYSDRTPDHLEIKHADGIWREWKPLDDDGDALRLAVNLRIGLEITGVAIYADYAGRQLIEHVGMNRHAATRRAIVRAAAEIAG